MKQHVVTLIPGDGIGPQVVEAAKKVIDASGAKIQWEIMNAGASALEKEGSLLPGRLLDSIKKNGVALKGPTTTPIGTGFRSVNVALRQTLDLYACLRPCKSFKGIQTTRYNDVDVIVVRENTEDLYIGIEYAHDTPEAEKFLSLVESTGKKAPPHSGIGIKVISEAGTKRIVKFAFEYAKANGRKKVSAVHKANIMKFTDGLFMEVAKQVAAGYPEIEFESRLIDETCAGLVQRPHTFDVLVLPNLYGDIVSDLCAGLVGGLGVAPGANLSDKMAVFEPTHGSAPKYAGMNKVNPIATILSGVLMLRYLNEKEAADNVEKAVAAVIAEDKATTYDLKLDRNDPGVVGTSQTADAIIAKMAK